MAKILVVEDERNLRLLYEEELTEEGYEVLLAEDGQKALEIAKKNMPDLVILDIMMPGMDGIETLGKLLSQNNKIPVILNTAYSHYRNNFMSWMADAYVVKSSDLTELKSEIKRLLAERNKS
ncbi:MAG: response regulator [Planctomycetota bacterium]|nr:MAG: response regulator [Planctomycetota bacterium]